ncbi:heat shock protein DnaJ, partial [Fragilariopsis cylindrus CCMP1102]
SERDIRKQFRTRAMQIHPDKNNDGRAQEAFIAVENAASILSDKQQRNIYDE